MIQLPPSTTYDAFHVCRQVRVMPPRNGFGLNPAGREAVVIAGGIGITPLLAMACGRGGG